MAPLIFTTKKHYNMEKTIIVIESGFTYIGELAQVNHKILGLSALIKNASNIRRWGTSNGLGELANIGKQPETILDYTGTITVPINKILHLVEVLPEAQKTFEND